MLLTSGEWGIIESIIVNERNRLRALGIVIVQTKLFDFHAILINKLEPEIMLESIIWISTQKTARRG